MGVMRYREALNQALREEMQRDETVFLMGEDIGVFNGAFKVTAGLLDEFGEKRVRDTPISENTIVGMGVGSAMTGLRPVVELMTINFSLLAMDQIVNHMATIHYMFGGQVRVPMVVRMPQGAGHQLGPTHSHCFEALFLHVPGMLLAAPSTAADAKGLLKSAIRDDNPVVFIEHEYLYGQRGDVPDDDDYTVDFGQAAIRREGEDVTIVGISRMAVTAQNAANILADEHEIEAEVIDPRTLRPLDLDTILASVRKTNRCVIVEEGWPHGGVGANLAALIQEQAFDHLDAPVGPGDRSRPADALLQAARADRLPARAAGGGVRDRHLPRHLGATSSQLRGARKKRLLAGKIMIRWAPWDECIRDPYPRSADAQNLRPGRGLGGRARRRGPGGRRAPSARVTARRPRSSPTPRRTTPTSTPSLLRTLRTS